MALLPLPNRMAHMHVMEIKVQKCIKKSRENPTPNPTKLRRKFGFASRPGTRAEREAQGKLGIWDGRNPEHNACASRLCRQAECMWNPTLAVQTPWLQISSSSAVKLLTSLITLDLLHIVISTCKQEQTDFRYGRLVQLNPSWWSVTLLLHVEFNDPIVTNLAPLINASVKLWSGVSTFLNWVHARV